MSAIATCTRCGASTKLTDRLADQLQGKATCVACAGDCVIEADPREDLARELARQTRMTRDWTDNGGAS